ncbi:hypothetical protein [Stenotrophomonas oahuensis]|uniref:Uncharacterized protein n=1 Tax=Stenotrophomonas oahuensis TaxID=3003271 RepID=A0ABY9YPB8_9GAMM|nr:hypothetical protein [Stenotrophomonas sp. A5586]WNH52441.1 hypothetical protein PDM29_19310 [Stenotrophomonas sp. A5586]
MKDLMGNPLEAGDYFVYAHASCSSIYTNIGRVMPDGKFKSVTVYRDGGVGQYAGRPTSDRVVKTSAHLMSDRVQEALS